MRRCPEDRLSQNSRIAHTLKTTSRTIGAEALSQASFEIEMALADGENRCPRELLEDLSRELQRVLLILHNRDGALHRKIVETASDVATLDARKALILVRKIEPLLKGGASKSLEYAAEIRNTLAPMGEICDELTDHIRNYDFELACEVLATIKDQLEALHGT